MMHARAHIGQHVEGIAQSLGLDTGPELHFDSDTQAVHIYVDSATCTVVPSLLVSLAKHHTRVRGRFFNRQINAGLFAASSEKGVGLQPPLAVRRVIV
jgi:hypothetical protein